MEVIVAWSFIVDFNYPPSLYLVECIRVWICVFACFFRRCFSFLRRKSQTNKKRRHLTLSRQISRFDSQRNRSDDSATRLTFVVHFLSFSHLRVIEFECSRGYLYKTHRIRSQLLYHLSYTSPCLYVFMSFDPLSNFRWHWYPSYYKRTRRIPDSYYFSISSSAVHWNYVYSLSVKRNRSIALWAEFTNVLSNSLDNSSSFIKYFWHLIVPSRIVCAIGQMFPLGICVRVCVFMCYVCSQRRDENE